MNIPPRDAERLTLWEFTAMRTVWNKRHKATSEGDDGPVEIADVDFVRARQEELVALGIAG